MRKENIIRTSAHDFFRSQLYTQSALSQSLFTARSAEGAVLFKQRQCLHQQVFHYFIVSVSLQTNQITIQSFWLVMFTLEIKGYFCFLCGITTNHFVYTSYVMVCCCSVSCFMWKVSFPPVFSVLCLPVSVLPTFFVSSRFSPGSCCHSCARLVSPVLPCLLVWIQLHKAVALHTYTFAN